MAIKTTFNMKHTTGKYETFHFETDASQVLTNSNYMFVNQTEKNNWNNKANSNHNHPEYMSSRGGDITGTLNLQTENAGEIQIRGQANGFNSGLYFNKEGRVGIYDWQNERGVFQYNANSGIMDFSNTCIFYGRLRTELGLYFDGGDSRICKYYSSYRFDIDGNWRNSQLEAGQIYIQPWSTEGTALCVNKDGERTNGRTDLTIVPSQNNYGILGRSSRYWYIAWSTAWRTPSYRQSKYDIMRTDENRLYEYVKNIKIYNYRRISGDLESEKTDADYRGDLQMGAMVNELPFEVVDCDTEHGEGKGIDLYAYSSMIAGALKISINKIEKLERDNEMLKNKLNVLEDKINGIVLR